MKLGRNYPAVLWMSSALILVVSSLSARAQYQPSRATVRAIHGKAAWSRDGQWQPLQPDADLTAGAMIKTDPATTLDLFLPDSRTILRLMPGSVLRFDRLDKLPAGELGLTMTRLSLLSGSLIGSQHKLVRPSEFEVRLQTGVAKIVGTEYSLKADGTVACLSGTVTMAYQPPGSSLPVNVSVAAGYSSDPVTGKAIPTSTDYLQNLTTHIEAVRQNDAACNLGQPDPNRDCTRDEVSPTHRDHHPGHGDDHGRGDDHGHGDDSHHGDGPGNGCGDGDRNGQH